MYDRIVQPQEGYTIHWRYTKQFSPLTATDLEKVPVTFDEAREAVIALLKDKVVVCHDIGCDMRVLRYQYISAVVQDTALYYCVGWCQELGLEFGPPEKAA